VLCNFAQAYNSEAVHTPSTGHRKPVNSRPNFIHSPRELSTGSVDNSGNLWIRVFGGSYTSPKSAYNAIFPVDKVVDKRGKNCG
jgi:hypothetical protein